MPGVSCDLCGYVGFATVAFIGMNLLVKSARAFKVFMLTSKSGLDLSYMGPWSVVTGATDGIGLGYARELARLGQNVVLISRSADKLKDCADKIAEEFGVETRWIAADFTDEEIYGKLAKELDGVEVGTLVNNVGMGLEYPEYFTQVPDGMNVHKRMLKCNVFSVVNMTHVVLPGMLSRKRGVIINISSASETLPSAMLSVYAATKAFVLQFSDCLRLEVAPSGVVVQCVSPFFVATKLSKIRKTSFFVPSPQTFVTQALRSIGTYSHTYGALSHELQGFVLKYLPKTFMDATVISQMQGVKKRFLAKKARDEKKE